MKKINTAVLVIVGALLACQCTTVSACTGFIIGKDLTTDGSALYGRTEDLEPNHNKTFVVRPAKTNPEGEQFLDQANGFSYPLPAQSHQYTAIPDVTPDQGVFDEAGFNQYGVSLSATVSASANQHILDQDPYVEDGLAESAMASLILPHVTTAREGVELLAKVIAEKGAAEGNIVVLADKDGIWYMEILSGHQYVAIRFPDDKFAVFPNTFFLGQVDFTDTEQTIASEQVEEIARQAGTYTEVDGHFHVALSYNPPLSDANRSRSYSGIKCLDPDSPVTFTDSHYELLQSTDKRFDVTDAMALQRNRFEGLELKPLDQMVLDGKGNPSSRQSIDGYAYPISNPNVMEAHIFQLKETIPADLGGGVLWLSVGSSRFAPYLPYYGNITDTYAAYKDTSTSYSPNSWYWVVSHIYNIVSSQPDKYASHVLSEVHALETQYIEAISSNESSLLALYQSDPNLASQEATTTSMARAEEAFQKLKDIEKELVEAEQTANSHTGDETPLSKQYTDEQTGLSVTLVGTDAQADLTLTVQPNPLASPPATLSDYQAFDIQFHTKEGKVYTIQQTATVHIPIPEGKEVEQVLYLAEAGSEIKPESLPFTLEENYVTFQTNHFSIYALSFKTPQDSATQSGSPSSHQPQTILPNTGTKFSSLVSYCGLLVLLLSGWLMVADRKPLSR